ncbi:MAG: Lrp/AsnC family transcriptional regulator [Alphaproteobacteria bacterium]
MLDRIDRKILNLLQKDASIPLEEIANRVNLSKTPCWNRIKKLERDGVIKQRVAILEPSKIGLGTTVFLMLRACEHTAEWMERFAEAVTTMSQVVGCYRMSGSIDYLIQVRVEDVAAYDRFYKKLIHMVPLTDVTSSFALEEMKFTTMLPLSEE